MAVEVARPAFPDRRIKHRHSLNMKEPRAATIGRPKNGSERRLHVSRRESSSSEVEDRRSSSSTASSGPELEDRPTTLVESSADDYSDMIEISLVPGAAAKGCDPHQRESSRSSSCKSSSALDEWDDNEHIDALLDSARDGEIVAFRRACNALLARNIRLDVRGRLGWTAAHWAARGGHLPILEHLVRMHVNLDVVDRRGDSLLHKAAANGQFRMCQWLLDRGFNVQARNNLGRSPLDAAQEHAAMKKSSDAELCEAILERTYNSTF